MINEDGILLTDVTNISLDTLDTNIIRYQQKGVWKEGVLISVEQSDHLPIFYVRTQKTAEEVISDIQELKTSVESHAKKLPLRSSFALFLADYKAAKGPR